jgi:uncharacterized protein with GYD domain
MATYLMLGKYSMDSIKGISADRTQKARELLEQYGGRLQTAYALLGEHDLALVVDLPDNQHALKASVALAKLLAISFTSAPAVAVEEFDTIMKQV